MSTASTSHHPEVATPPSRDGFWRGIMETLAAGTAAGFFAEVVLYPIEGNLHSHLVLNTARIPSNVSLTELSKSEPKLLSPYWRIDKFAVAGDMSKSLFQKAPATGLMMAAYEYAKEVTKSRILAKDASPLTVGLVAGTLGQLLESAIWTPFSTALARRETLARDFSLRLAQVEFDFRELPADEMKSWEKRMGVFRCARDVVGDGGWRALYKGYWTSFATSVPYIAAFYAIGDALTNYYTAKHVLKWKESILDPALTNTTLQSSSTSSPMLLSPSPQSPPPASIPPGADSTPPPLPLSTLGLIGGISATLAVLVSTPIEFLRLRVISEFAHIQSLHAAAVAAASTSFESPHARTTLASYLNGLPSRIRTDLGDRVFRQATRGSGRKVLVNAIKRGWRNALASAAVRDTERKLALGLERRVAAGAGRGAVKAGIGAVRGFVRGGGFRRVMSRVLSGMGRNGAVRKAFQRVVQGLKSVGRAPAARQMFAKVIRTIARRGH